MPEGLNRGDGAVIVDFPRFHMQLKAQHVWGFERSQAMANGSYSHPLHNRKGGSGGESWRLMWAVDLLHSFLLRSWEGWQIGKQKPQVFALFFNLPLSFCEQACNRKKTVSQRHFLKPPEAVGPCV